MPSKHKVQAMPREKGARTHADTALNPGKAGQKGALALPGAHKRSGGNRNNTRRDWAKGPQKTHRSAKVH